MKLRKRCVLLEMWIIVVVIQHKMRGIGNFVGLENIVKRELLVHKAVLWLHLTRSSSLFSFWGNIYTVDALLETLCGRWYDGMLLVINVSLYTQKV